MRRFARVIPVALGLLAVCAFAQQPGSQTPARSKRIVIAAGALLDGKGHVSRNTRIVIEGARIVAIDPKAGPVDYDLRGLTVMPGWIDMHTHLTSSFGKDGKAGGDMTAEESAYRTASNAWVTLLGGFTTVQTMSQAVALRDAIANGAYEATGIGSNAQAAHLKGLHTSIMCKKDETWMCVGARSIVR